MHAKTNTHLQGPASLIKQVRHGIERYFLVLIIWMALCLAAASWYLYVTPPSFTASATILLEPKRTSSGSGETINTTPSIPLDSAQAESQIQVIKSERLLSSVFNGLKLADRSELQPETASLKNIIFSWFANDEYSQDGSVLAKASASSAFNNFVNRVSPRRIGQSYVIEVSYTSSNPKTARELANSIVSGYLLQQVSFKLAAAQNGAEYLQGRINSLANEVKFATAGMLTGEVPSSLLPDADARVIGAAIEPLSKSSPKAGLILSFATTFGLMTGLFSIALLSSFDRKIRTSSQVEIDVGVVCLGVVPDIRKKEVKQPRVLEKMYAYFLLNQNSYFAIAVRDIRTSILMNLQNEPNSVIGFVSSTSGSGKTLISASLSKSLSQAGFRTILIDADVYGTTNNATSIFGSEKYNLIEVLSEFREFRYPSVLHIDHNFDFIPSMASNDRTFLPNIYLASDNMKLILSESRILGNVIVDLPSFDVCADARSATSIIDFVIIVIEYNKTTIEDARSTVDIVERSGSKVMGILINKFY